jgi:type II protein arginine methyltransferase
MSYVADGISIPASYTAYLAPMSSSKLYIEAHASKDEKGPETPYVVMFQAINILSSEDSGISGRCGGQVQECWEFEHPRRDAMLDAQGKLMSVSYLCILITSRTL